MAKSVHHLGYVPVLCATAFICSAQEIQRILSLLPSGSGLIKMAYKRFSFSADSSTIFLSSLAYGLQWKPYLCCSPQGIKHYSQTLGLCLSPAKASATGALKQDVRHF